MRRWTLNLGVSCIGLYRRRPPKVNQTETYSKSSVRTTPNRCERHVLQNTRGTNTNTHTCISTSDTGRVAPTRVPSKYRRIQIYGVLAVAATTAVLLGNEVDMMNISSVFLFSLRCVLTQHDLRINEILGTPILEGWEWGAWQTSSSGTPNCIKLVRWRFSNFSVFQH